MPQEKIVRCCCCGELVIYPIQIVQLPFEVPWSEPVWYDTHTDLFASDQPLAIAFICANCHIDRKILMGDIWLCVEFDRVDDVVKYHCVDWDKREVVV